MVGTTTLLVVAVLALVAASAFFSSTEIAIFSLPTERLAAIAELAPENALTRLRSNPHRLLVTLLVGNTLVNMAIASLSTLVAIQTLPPNLAVPAATLGSATLVLIFGEILPKSWGLGNAERWATRAAPVVRFIELALYPIVAFFDTITRTYADATSGEPDIEELVLDE